MQKITLTAGDRVSVIHFHDELFVPAPDPRDGLLYVFDGNTHRLFSRFAPPAGAQLAMPAGEPAKSWDSVRLVLEGALAAGLTRAGIIVGVGGGVVGDVAGFASSLYMRGCRLVLVPTTLVAMVDAAIGGKTGVDFGGYKNLIGTFYPAGEIHIGVGALSTLPAREYHSGLAEVIKTAALGDAELFELLEGARERVLARERALLAEIVRRCVAVKVRIVEEDPREQGCRAWLNLGHTFGHALEAVTGMQQYTHGEAVAWGMAQAMELGLRLGVTRPAYAERMRRMLADYGFRTRIPDLDLEALLAAMERDKKNRGGKLRFVLQEDLCSTRVLEVRASEAAAVLR